MQGTVDEVAIDGHQLVVIPCLEVLPREVVVLRLRGIGRQHVAQDVLLAGEILKIFVQPDGPVARSRYLVALQVEELVGGYIVRQDVATLGLQHGGEDDAVEDDVILADEVDEARLGVFPPLFPVVGQQLLGVADVADGRIKPYIQHLALGTLHRHGNTPIQVAAHGTGLQAHVQPTLALAVDVGTPLLVVLQYPLAQPWLVLVQRQIPVRRLLHHGFASADGTLRINQLCGAERRAALLALVAISTLSVATGTFARDVAVGQESLCLLVIILHRGLLDKLALVIELAEEVRCCVMVHLRCGASIDIERNAEFFERLFDELVIAVHDRRGW